MADLVGAVQQAGASVRVGGGSGRARRARQSAQVRQQLCDLALQQVRALALFCASTLILLFFYYTYI
jgi:hypothetical protein